MMYNMINIINTAVCYIWKLLREQILGSHHKENIFFFLFLLFCIFMRWWMSLNLLWSSVPDVW